MSYEEHPVFRPPNDPTAPIFRYLDLAKLVSMLDGAALFFARSDRLGDAFEGSMTAANLDFRPELFQGIPETHWPQIVETRRRVRQWTFINCWTASPTESIAMWRLYVGDGNGLAIESTFQRLVEAMAGSERIHVGMVRYTNWNTGIIPEGNLLEPFVHKRTGFEYEHELRAIVQKLPTSGDQIDWSVEPPTGLVVPIDVARLVARVRLSPVAGSWYRDTVRSVVGKYGFEFEISQSDLSGDPVY